jgi:predicted lactoylglutathione lyase
MTQMIFVNLPVTDLDRSKSFYEALGFRINPDFTDDTAACVVISEAIYLMILTRDRFRGFSPLPVAETTQTTAVLIALSRDSRDGVDRITDAAIAAGGHEPKAATDMGFMYTRTFLDPDGNVFEPMWMDPAAIPGQPA